MIRIGPKTIKNEIRNFILWYFHQNENEAEGIAKKLYDGIDTFMDEVYEEVPVYKNANGTFHTWR